MANPRNLIDVIAQKVQTANTSADVLALAKSMEIIDTGFYITVANYSQLPDPTTLPAGALYYVVSDKMMYYVKPNEVGVKYWESITNNTTQDLVWGWGEADANDGKLGDGTTVDKCSPVSVVGGFTDWYQVSAGFDHAAAVRQNGTLWTWGNRNNGMLGDDTNTNRSSPVSVVGGFTDWCQVSTGERHTIGLRTNGTLWSWGGNSSDGSFGILGDGTTTNRTSPVSVVGGFTDWCQVSAGCHHTAAVRTNGTLWAWGLGGSRLGDGGTTSRNSPVSVIGGFTDWCQVSAGTAHTAAVRQNGTLWTWGGNSCGRLGDGTTEVKSSPVSVVGGFTDWCQVSAGGSHTSAVRTNGTLWAWGYGDQGRLGQGSNTDRSSPVSVVGGFTDWCQVSAGREHTAAVRTNGTLWTWGLGICGRLGDGSISNRNSPVSVLSGFTDWCQVSAGECNSFAVRRRKI
jgi:alpha-tubulin suppressor-like RCC1 family protein